MGDLVMSTNVLIDDMGVANVGFLIENLNKDAGELQYLRELVQNAFEAILRRGGFEDGRVVIDAEEIDGVRKLRITDNGIGMTPEEVRKNINHLSASAGIQAFDKNFGIGAKITAAVRNPYGVMYKAWKENAGSLTVLGRHNSRYGRIGWANPDDGSVDYWVPLRDEDRHPIIKQSGISVVLLGKSKNDDTTVAPPHAEFPSRWVAAFLERRYFEIPAGISLRVLRSADIYDSELGGTRTMYVTVHGQHHYLDKNATLRGLLKLPRVDAEVYWWILNDGVGAFGQTWNNRGHVAALYQSELYEVKSGTARIGALKDFGIYAGHNRIVIYVVPTNVVGANTARSALIVKGGKPVDYAGIGAAFAEDMPDEVAGFMSGQVSAEPGDHRRSILKNLKEVEEALEFARYRRGSGPLEHVMPEPGGQPSRAPNRRLPPENTLPSPDRTQEPRDAAGRAGSAYFQNARDELVRHRVRRIDSDPLPEVVWDRDGNTVPAGRAATYTHASHVVTASAQFDLYQDFLEWSVEKARKRVSSEVDDVTLRKICADEVERWFSEALSQAVVVLRSKAHDARWPPTAYETALSDEGLTVAVVSHRWLLLSAIKRGLAGRLGSMRDSVDV